MRTKSIFRKSGLGIILMALTMAICGGCSNDGPAIEARSQTIIFQTAPLLALGNTATVVATASSGLAVNYSSSTPAVCSVNSGTGIVTGISGGTCIIAANQSGNTQYAPAPQVTQTLPVATSPIQTIIFGSLPTLSLGGSANVSATASSGLPVTYSSTTQTVCTVNSSTGMVTDLTAGACIIAANQAGNANINAAPQVTQTITVSVPSSVTVPGAPTGVTATSGGTLNAVIVSVGPTDSGGSPITGYTVTSIPAGIAGSGTSSHITVTCPGSCSGYAFAAAAVNSIGSGLLSAPTDVLTTYDVVETFHEPDTQPKNSIFIGAFTLNSTTGAVSNLHGILSESMTGGLTAYPNDTMNWLTLNNQLSSVPVTLGGVDGLLVTTFLLSTTNTFTTAYGGDGWAPGTGFATYYGFPSSTNPKAGGVGNAYAMIFVNTANPTVTLTQAQMNKLAYADCAAGGMMGSACMTGTTIAGYGTIGSMSGHPVSQIITKGITP